MSRPAPPSPAPAGRPRRRWWPWLLAALVLLAALLVGAGAGLRWVLHTESGTRWALDQAARHVPGFVVRDPQGSLLGDFQARQLVVPAGATTVEVQQLHWSGLRLHGWRLSAPYVQLGATEIAAGRVVVRSAPPEEAAAAARPQPPASLRLPLGVQVDALRVDELVLPGQAVPVTALRARLVAGEQHAIESFSAAWNGLRAEAEARIGADAPLPVQARVRVTSDPEAGAGAPIPAWAQDVQAELGADGPLERLAATLSLHMQEQSLQAEAGLAPFEPLPLSRLDARFRKLDLARLLGPFTALAPTTQLDGSAVVTLRDGGQPMGIEVELANALPGSWHALRLPLARAVVQASGEGRRWTVQRAELDAAGAPGHPAGRLSATGSWNDGELQLQATLASLVLEALDQRLPPMLLSGPVTVQMTPGATPDAPFGTVQLRTTLQGGLTRRGRAGAPQALQDGQPVQLVLEADGTPTRYQVTTLEARAGEARLQARGSAQRDERERWQVQAGLDLRAFNPAQWVPGPPEAAWRRQRHALNGTVKVDAEVPAQAPDAATLLRQLRGTLQVALDDSLLAGQAAQLGLKLDADGAGRLGAQGQLLAAGNTAALDGLVRLPVAGRAAPADDHVRLTLEAPALQRLAGLAEALGLGTLQGQARLQAEVQGPLGGWIVQATAPAPRRGMGTPALPPLRTEGQADVQALRAGGIGLDRLQGRWDASTEGAGRLSADLQAAQLRLPGLQVPAATLRADGSLAAHRAQLEAALEPATGRAAATTPDGRPAAPLALTLALAGRWDEAGSPPGWRGTLETLALRPTDSAPALLRGEQALPLLVAENLHLAWLEDAGGGRRLEVEPGQLRLLDQVVRWSEARWRRGAGDPQLDVELQVEPVAIIPLLQRVQPDFGWEGDLRIGARVSLHTDPEVRARIELARTGGDVRINEFGVVQALGLGELQLRLEAAQGTWRFSQRIAGSNLGRIVGDQAVRTLPTALWPQPEAPVAGQLEMQVDNLAGWGIWMPAGWRLGGQLSAQLEIAGQFGGPNLVGRLEGRQLAVRNAIEGVNLHDGTVRMSFEGETARVETLRFAAGDGHAELQGSAQLGADPVARLQLQAKQFALLSRVDRRVVVSGEAAMQLDRERIGVEGRFRADEGLIDISRADAPSLSEDVVVRGADDEDEDAAAKASAGPARDLALDLRVNLGERFRLRGRGIDTRLEGDLHLTSPRNRLAVAGEIRTVDGSYQAYGQDLEIERGVLTFVGEVANPRLDIVAIRPNLDQRVGVTVSGSALSPRVSLFSEPPLSDTEKLALLVTGRSYDTLAGNQTLLLQRAALALLAGDGSGEGRNIMDMMPLDELSVRQTEGAVPDTVVSIGKQISDRIYVGYERGLSAAAGSWQVVYRIAQRFTLRAQAGQDSALDLVWMFRWN